MEPAPIVAPARLAIVGCTASGKSALAMAIARECARTEIVAVDAMTMYRGLDIGTAKPSSGERAEIRHHGLDIAEVEQDPSLIEFRHAVEAAMVEIAGRTGRAVLVGGTGLYLRAVIDGLDPPGRWPEIRQELEDHAARGPDQLAELYRELSLADPSTAAKTDPANGRRIVRALEVCRGSGRAFSSFGPGLDHYPDNGVRQIGLRWERDRLRSRIAERVHAQIEAGWLDEVAAMWPRMGRTAAQVIGYRELSEHLDGRRSLDDAVEAVVLRTQQFAVRQERWFRRDPRVEWYSGEDPQSALASVRDQWRQ